jgi:hypothetical protein
VKRRLSSTTHRARQTGRPEVHATTPKKRTRTPLPTHTRLCPPPCGPKTPVPTVGTLQHPLPCSEQQGRPQQAAAPGHEPIDSQAWRLNTPKLVGMSLSTRHTCALQLEGKKRCTVLASHPYRACQPLPCNAQTTKQASAYGVTEHQRVLSCRTRAGHTPRAQPTAQETPQNTHKEVRGVYP